MHVEEILDVLGLSSTTVMENVMNLPIEDVREVRMNARGCVSDDCQVDAKQLLIHDVLVGCTESFENCSLGIENSH